MQERLRQFLTIRDSRFEDLTRDNYKTVLYRDFSAGLVTAMTAIPMAMGFAMAMGLRPEQGIIAGAMACLVGRTFGGSKYQVYGPTAAFIPLIYGILQKYDHGFLVFASILAGVLLCALGLAGMGKIAKHVPNSVVVGFTVGIGISIAATNLYDVLGINAKGGTSIVTKLQGVWDNSDQVSLYALGIGLLTFALTRYLLRLSIYIPAPLIAVAAGTMIAATAWGEKGLTLVRTKYGEIPTNFFVFTPPVLPEVNSQLVMDLMYAVVAIAFISGVESLLCSSMADRLAGNRKTPFNPDREFWGQGLVQIITPLVNGFPCTGALARTATSIRAGAVTPLAGYFKFALKLGMALFLARYLELVPMACIGGIMLWVSSNMINVKEIKHVWATGRFHAFLMTYTAVMVPLTDFLTGVLSSLVLYFILRRFVEPVVEQLPAVAAPQTGEVAA
ncbi:MAG: SulP family inorganic anion transporter [Bryobacteraceae bacterium]